MPQTGVKKKKRKVMSLTFFFPLPPSQGPRRPAPSREVTMELITQVNAKTVAGCNAPGDAVAESFAATMADCKRHRSAFPNIFFNGAICICNFFISFFFFSCGFKRGLTDVLKT